MKIILIKIYSKIASFFDLIILLFKHKFDLDEMGKDVDERLIELKRENFKKKYGG